MWIDWTPLLFLSREKVKPAYLPGDDVCRVSQEQVEMLFARTRIPKDLKRLWNVRQANVNDIEIPEDQEAADNCKNGTGCVADMGYDREG